MQILLTAIWPSFANIPNHVPESEGLYTNGFIAFLLYFLLQLPFLCIPYTKVCLSLRTTSVMFWLIASKVQYFFALKSVIAPIVFLAIFGSTLHKAGGTVSHSSVITQQTTLTGSALAWAFFASRSCCALKHR